MKTWCQVVIVRNTSQLQKFLHPWRSPHQPTWCSNVCFWRQDRGCMCLLGTVPRACQPLPCPGWDQQRFCPSYISTFWFSEIRTASSNANGRPKLGLITFWCVKPVIHNRKGKAIPNNTLPIPSEPPSTSVFQAVQFKCTFETGESEISLPNSL